MARLPLPKYAIGLPTIEDAYEHFVVPNPELYTAYVDSMNNGLVAYDPNKDEWRVLNSGDQQDGPSWRFVCTHNELVKMHLAKINSEETSTEADPVEHPPHYTNHPSGIECIQVTEHMGFNLGNALKYIWRCDLKHDAIEDLRKAKWYLEREIAKREKSKSSISKVNEDYEEQMV